MKFTVAILALAGTMAFGALGARGTVAAQGAASQWDGIYTEAQAKRGEPLYAQYCASCHGPDLAGGEMAPGLTGGESAAATHAECTPLRFPILRNTGSTSRSRCR